MFEDFPKTRIELPATYKKIYEEHYLNNRSGKTNVSAITSKLERWMHRKVAEDVIGDASKKTLEIGAGNLNQLKYESTEYYDIVEPNTFFYAGSMNQSRVHKIYASTESVKTAPYYDRITSIATFEHLVDLPKVVAHACLLLNEKGTLRVAIPNEGSLAWKIGWMLTSAIEFRIKYGLNYGTLMQYEHVNTAKEIEKVLTHFFSKVHITYYGINKRLAWYHFFACENPHIERANAYLNSKLCQE